MATTTSDDYSGDISTKGRISVDGSVHGTFEKAGDSDWFRAHLDAGVSYRFTLNSDSGAFFLGASYVSSVDGGVAVGPVLLSSFYDRSGSSITYGYTPLASGDYLFQANSYSMVGGYTLALSTDSYSYPDEAGNTLAGASTLPLNTLRAGTIGGPGDADVYKLNLDSGTRYSIVLDRGDTKLTFALFVDGVYKDIIFSSEPSTVFQYTPIGAHTVAVAVYGDYGVTGAYQIRASRTIDHDGYTSDIHTAGKLSGTSAAGNLEAGDGADWIAVSLTSGKRFALELYTAASSSYTLGKGGTALPVLDLIDRYGNVISSASSGGLGGDPRIEFSVPASKEYTTQYFLAVRDQRGSGTGTYAVAVHEAAPTVAGDISNDPSQAYLLASGAVVQSTVDVGGDVDYFAVKLSAGVLYDFDLSIQSKDGRYAYVSPVLQGREVAADLGDVVSGADGHSHLLYKAGASGYYTLALRSIPGYGGDYKISYAAAAQQDVVGDSIASATPLAVGAVVKGMIDTYQDLDVYAVTLEAGKSYDFYLDGGLAENGGLPAGRMQLLSMTGVSLGAPLQDMPSTVGHLTYTAPASGTFYLQVDTSTRQIGTYQLSVERTGAGVAAPQFGIDTLVSKSNQITLAGKAQAGIKLQFYAGADLLGSATADASGAFSFSATLKDGVYQVYAVAANEQGKLSVPSSTVGVTVDTLAPSATLVSAFAVGNAVTLSGWAEEASWVRIWANGAEVGKVQASNLGAWNTTLTLKDGGYSISVTAIDLAGNESVSWRSQQLQVGTVVVGVPGMEDGPAGGFGSNRIALSGSADAGSLVYVMDGKTLIASARADAGGHWSTVSSPLADGVHVLAARAENSAGVSSFMGTEHYVRIDTTAPAAPSVQVRLGVDGAALGTRPVLYGDSEAHASITISRDGAVAGYAVADQHGHWQWQSGELAAGGYRFAAKAGDALGNVSELGAVLAVQVSAAAVQSGGAQRDVIEVGPGSHVLDAGAGLDTAVVRGAGAGYTLSVVPEGLLLGSPEASVLLLNVERLRFSDGAIAFDSGGTAGQVYRVYQAAFGRQPDKGGLGYWIAQMDQGMSLHDVADGFVHSAEYAALYGAAPTAAELVAHLYQNVLHRAADVAGAAYWVSMLEHGADRADVLSAFSESAENQAQLIGLIQGGMAYTPFGG